MAVTKTMSMVGVGDGVELCAETYGDPGDPAVLLIHGATAPMDWWDPELCSTLATPGRFVIRYDHRDSGASTTWPLGEPGYTGEDLSLDPLRLLDGLGVGPVHLVGVSMGGGIAQDLAARFPDRVLSLTLIATSCALERHSEVSLPGMDPRLLDEDEPEVDWSDPEAAVDELVRQQELYAGSLGDHEHTREIARRVVTRSRDIHAGTVNHWQVIGSGEDDAGPRPTMADIVAPTLVIHGTDDPMFPLPHCEALAAEITGATLLTIDGMGHEAPPRPTWDTVLPAITAHTSR